MRPEALKLLFDIQRAADLILQFTRGKTVQEYSSEPMMASAVERQFEIIAFRNVLIHGYSSVDDEVVWDIIEKKLPVLRTEVRGMLGDEGNDSA
jgi:uncharacterized protein with HEPN domain